MTKLHHVSPRADLTLIEPREQIDTPNYKPKGLWYEVDADWRRWCRDDGMGTWIDGHFVYALSLDPALRLLTLRTAAAIDRFTTRYAAHSGIDWRSVADRWDGIEIAPYQWSRRFHPDTAWYYGWDCASGCIWAPRGSSLALVGPTDPAPPVLDEA